MTASAPTRLADALACRAEHPDWLVVAGGTDCMVEVNFGSRRPTGLLGLRRVADLAGWARDGDDLRLGAGVTFSDLEREPFRTLVPALAQAARTVGSPQIRNAATIAGNLATGSPAGDSLPVLVALGARVELSSVRGTRELPATEFVIGPKRTALAADELVTTVIVPVVSGPQEFLKVGTRNAMVISVASVALIADLGARTVRVGLGSVGPTPLRAPEAEAWASTTIDWDRRLVDIDAAIEFGVRVADAARPIDDHRSSAAYRRHAIGVCARRALERAFPTSES